jgi:hypothetical protein
MMLRVGLTWIPSFARPWRLTDVELSGIRNVALVPHGFITRMQAEMEVKAIEEFRQVSAPPAHYYPAPEDRSRKAVFYANIYQAEKRPLYQNASIGVCRRRARYRQ